MLDLLITINVSSSVEFILLPLLPSNLERSVNLHANSSTDIINGINYQSDYTAGLRIYDISSIPENPKGDDVCESKSSREDKASINDRKHIS